MESNYINLLNNFEVPILEFFHFLPLYASTPLQFRGIQYVFPPFVYTSSLQTPIPVYHLSFHISGVHAQEHDTQITCLSHVSG